MEVVLEVGVRLDIFRARQGIPINHVNYEMSSAEQSSASWSLNTR
jgi:hypothetical protein